MTKLSKENSMKSPEDSGMLISRRKILASAGLALGAGLLFPGQVIAEIADKPKVIVKDRKPAGNTVVFTHTTVVTGDANKAQLKDVALAVKDGLIAAIGANDLVLKQYPDAEIIDGRYKALLPGIANCHAHLGAAVARGFNEDYGFPNRSGLSPGRTLSAEGRTIMAMTAALHSIRCGSTTVVEYTRNIAENAPELAKTGLRWVFAEGVNDLENNALMSPEAFAASQPPRYSPKLREEGLQRIEDLYSKWHGHNKGRIQVFPAVTHTENASPDLLRAIRGFADKHDLGYTIHLSQTHAEVAYMKKYYGLLPTEYLDKHEFLGPRLFVAHARYVNQKEIDLLGKTKTIIAHQASMAANRGVSPPIPAMRDAGCTICMGTDNNNNDMFAVMKVAMLTERIRRSEDEHPGMFPQPEDILQDGALGGAHATNQIKTLGLLEVGKKADLVVLNTRQVHLTPAGRILSAWLHNGQPSDIESVMVDGEFIMRDHKILTVDEESIINEASKMGQQIWSAIEKGGPLEPPGRKNWR